MKLLLLLAMVTGLGIYPSAGTVADVDREADIVTWVDGAGEEWTITECDDWEIGDGIATIMWDHGTEYIYDDVIVDYRYTAR